MKKNILAIAILLNGTLIMAQTEFDALKLIQPDINGTARYMSMAGAFGALGGDASAIKDNPAGLGIYRSSEITGTLNLLGQNSNAMWNSSVGSDRLLNAGFNNFAYIKATPTYKSQIDNSGLLSSNWSFSFNRLKSFDRNSTVIGNNQSSSITDYMSYFTGNIKSADLSSSNSPYDNTSVPWISVVGYQGFLINESVDANGQSSWSSLLNQGEMVQPTYKIQENGSIDEYSIGWAGNFGNDLFLGANINLQSVDYSMRSQYSENFGSGGGMTLTNYLNTTGAGFNLNVGAIYSPIDLLRLGVSVHSPTLIALTDNNSANLDYYLTSTTNGNFDTPSASNSYSLVSPWRVDASAALILPQLGLLSAEYSNSFSTNAYFFDSNGSTSTYMYENAGMKSMLKNVQTIKIGAEYKLTNNLSVRAGFANMSAGSNLTADKLLQPNTTRTDVAYFLNNNTNFYTAGIGYRQAGWYIDFAYINKFVDETFYPYNSNNLAIRVIPADVQTTSNNFVFTVGLKF